MNADYRKANKEKCRAIIAAWESRNPDKVKASKKKWDEANPGATQSAIRKWKRANLAKLSVYEQNRRTRKQAALGAITPAEWQAIRKKQGGRCAYCQRKTALTMDHIVPLSAGGCNFAYNIQGLCGSCNSTKGARIPDIAWSLFDKQAP